MISKQLPHFLEAPKAEGETFGTLTQENGAWLIEGHPQAVLMAKRLFPGTSGVGRGKAQFPATRRIFPELVWFLHRWPMVITQPELFATAHQVACTHHFESVAARKELRPIDPSVSFKGVLEDFQKEGLGWMTLYKRTLLADEMGLGKTVQALALLATTNQWPVVVVAPPHLIVHWEKKTAEFLDVDSKGALPLFSRNALRTHTIKGRDASALPPADIYFIHYLLLADWRHVLTDRGFKLCVFDEVQELRRAGSAKYSAASEMASVVPSVVGLSGTPIYNRGGEIWNVLNVLDYHCLGDWDAFTREWCAGYGNDVITDPDLLGEHLKREGLLLRRRKADVLKNFPEKTRIIEPIESDSGAVSGLLRQAADLVARGDLSEDKFARGRLEMEAIKLTRQATGLAKAPFAAPFVGSIVEAGEATVVFAHHHGVIDFLLKKLAVHRPVCITGRETSAEKERSLAKFVSGATDLIIISLRTATGIDGIQKRANVVVFAELDWSPAVHSQAEDRAHRMGQDHRVLCYYLVTQFGSDPDVLEALGLKVSQFVGLMGDEAPETDEMLASRIAREHTQSIVEKLRQIGGRKRTVEA